MKRLTIRIAVPSRIHSADSAFGTYWEWLSATMLRISSACTFAIVAVDNTSSVLMILFRIYRMESKTFWGTCLRAAVTRHIE